MCLSILPRGRQSAKSCLPDSPYAAEADVPRGPDESAVCFDSQRTAPVHGIARVSRQSCIQHTAGSQHLTFSRLASSYLSAPTRHWTTEPKSSFSSFSDRLDSALLTQRQINGY